MLLLVIDNELFVIATNGEDKMATKLQNKKADELESFSTFYENGQLCYKGNYKNGEPEGAHVYYHENGQLVYKGNKKNGKEEGVWVSYHENGQLESTPNLECQWG
jgi:antitoxin component YwqK of YwqJK toxin-antitoxin module